MTRFCNETYNDIDNKDHYIDQVLYGAGFSICIQLIRDIALVFPTTHFADGRDVDQRKSESCSYDREVNLVEWLNNSCRADPSQVF